MTWRGAAPLLFVLMMSVASALAYAQRGDYRDPIPDRTVDPVVSPLVYQGGTVVLRVRVAIDGSVSGVEAIKPMPALTEPAMAAVRQWHFTPALSGGQPVAATTTVVVHIVLIRTIAQQ